MIKKIFVRREPVPVTKDGYKGPFTFEQCMGVWFCSFCASELSDCFVDECPNCGALYKTLEEIHDE